MPESTDHCRVVNVKAGNELRIVGEPKDWLGAEVGPEEFGSNAPHINRTRRASHLSRKAGILFAGPWIGEFGWELMRWQGGIRRIANQAGLYIIVMGDPGHELLYEYADEYWDVPAFVREVGLCRQCIHIRGDGTAAQRLECLAHLAARELLPLGKVRQTITPRRFRPDQQDFVCLESDTDRWSAVMSRPYCCLIVRARAWNPRKNWPFRRWWELADRLQDAGFGFTFISSSQELRAFCPELEIAPRDSLRRSVDLLHGAQFAIASESGGVFLSLLSGCPTLAFGHERWERRITVEENPLRTPVRYLGRAAPDFDSEEIADAARDFCKSL